MSYFTAVFALDGHAWRVPNVDVEDADSIDDLAEHMRGVARGAHPVIAVIEREDAWFALVRVDGDDDPRVFVSDLPAASRGPYADLLASAADVDAPAPALVMAVAARGEADPPARPAVPARSQDVPVRNVAPVVVDGPPDVDDLAGNDAEVDDDLEVDDLADTDAPVDELVDDDEVPDVDDLDEPDPVLPPVWAGDVGLLDDLGVDSFVLRAWTEDHTDDPATVLGEIGEQVGFADLLEALR